MSALDEAVQRDLWSTPPPTPVEELRKRARRRRARHLTAGLVAATLSLALIASIVTDATSDHHHVVAVTATPATPEDRQAHAATPTTPITFAPTAPTPVDSTALEPTQFFAAIGAGGERIAIVDTATGRRGPFLTSPSQVLVRFSNDHKTIYVPTLENKTTDTPTPAGCGRAWTAINVTTGASHPAYTDLGRPFDVVESPDGKKIAYVRPLHQNIANGCQYELVVRDKTSRQERRWSAPRALREQTTFQSITQLGWSPDSAHLTYVLNATTHTIGKLNPVSSTWILDINHGTSLTDGLQLRNPDADCTIPIARFRPGTNLVVAAENCLGSSAKLVDFNARTGAVSQITEVASGTIYGIVDLAFDASGRHLLYVLDGTSAQPSEVYVLRDGRPVPLLADAYQVSW